MMISVKIKKKTTKSWIVFQQCGDNWGILEAVKTMNSGY